MMTRHFNPAGPCQSDIHYMLPSRYLLKWVRPLVKIR
jgi:hypothetical protein